MCTSSVSMYTQTSVDTEICWDQSHDWSAVKDGYKHFRRDRQLRRGCGMALYIRGCFSAVDLGVGNYKIEPFWIRIRGVGQQGGGSLL